MAESKQQIINEQRDEITRLKTELKTKDEKIARLTSFFKFLDALLEQDLKEE